MSIYTIDSHQDFLKLVAEKVVQDKRPDKHLIILPTNRACRALKEEIIHLRPAIMMPQLLAMGQINYDSLNIMHIKQPKAINATQRNLLLSTLIYKSNFSNGWTQSLTLANSLAELIDQFNHQCLSLANIKKLHQPFACGHWDQIVQFLDIVITHWPKVLQQLQLQDKSKIYQQCVEWLCVNHSFFDRFNKVIVAGSTGSLNITKKLIATIHELPHGEIILPGLQSSINAPKAPHPQHTMHCLLQHLESSPSKVLAYTKVNHPPDNKLHYIECTNQEQESLMIAIMMRETLQTPNKKCLLITHDRKLTRMVSAKLKRWNIIVDDSAGIPLSQTTIGTLIINMIKALCLYKQDNRNNYDYIQLIISILKNPHFAHDHTPINDIHGWEEKLRRNQFNDQYIKLIEDNLDHVSPSWQSILDWLLGIIKHRIHTHHGNQAAMVLQELKDYCDILPFTQDTWQELDYIMNTLLSRHSIRLLQQSSDRLKILGPLEARLIQADRIILSGMNEGTWPIHHAPNPWFNNEMANQMGLPDKDQKLGLSHHDFMQKMTQHEVFCTRSLTIDSVSTIASRFLLKCNLDNTKQQYYQQLANHLLHNAIEVTDENDTDSDINGTVHKHRPPNPALWMRKQQIKNLSVTNVKTIINNPYQIFIQKILNLQPLNAFNDDKLPMHKGILFHELAQLKADADHDLSNEEIILLLNKHCHNVPALWQKFWQVQLDIIGSWLDTHLCATTNYITECKGRIQIKNSIYITAIADRIDINDNNTIEISDYKTGILPTKRSLLQCHHPQLAIETLILKHQGFPGIVAKQHHPQALNIIALKSNNQQIITIEDDDGFNDLCQKTHTMLDNIYDYYIANLNSFPASYKNSDYNPGYDHIARIKAWID